MKRFTVNFREPLDIADNKEAEAFIHALKEKHIDYNYDSRNGIYCIRPTNDIIMLHHYVEYLNSRRNEWTNYGWFDMGMVPIEMWPNFQQEVSGYTDIQIKWRDEFRNAGVPLVKTRSVSFLKPAYSTAYGVDHWVFRDDMFNYLKKLNESGSIIHIDNLQSPDQPLFSMYLDAYLKAIMKLNQEPAKTN